MKTTRFITAAVTAVILSTGAAMASTATAPTAYASDPVIAQISEQLAQQGYVIVSIEKTMLGRYQIEAVANGFSREIIVSTTGKVFRDDWHADTTRTATGLDRDHDGILDDGASVETGADDGVNGFPGEGGEGGEGPEGNEGNEGHNDDHGGNDDNGNDDHGNNDHNGNDDNGNDDHNGNDDNGNDDHNGNDDNGTEGPEGNDDNGIDD